VQRGASPRSSNTRSAADPAKAAAAIANLADAHDPPKALAGAEHQGGMSRRGTRRSGHARAASGWGREER